MIISASRRTDIPAFYAKWFVNRIRAGFCLVPAPFNPGHVSRVSLNPGRDVEAVVFWTRNATPLLDHLAELDARGLRYYFLYTLLGYDRRLETGAPALTTAIDRFRRLTERIGAERVIWRYDPIILSTLADAAFHRRTFRRIAEALRGYTRRCVVSLLDVYPKVRKNLCGADPAGFSLLDWDERAFGPLMRSLARTASSHGMQMLSCAESIDLSPYGIAPGKCIDDGLIFRLFGVRASSRKDPGQRSRCKCVVSRDIGVYDTCPYGCRYCYATTSPERARARYRRHDPWLPGLIPLS